MRSGSALFHPSSPHFLSSVAVSEKFQFLEKVWPLCAKDLQFHPWPLRLCLLFIYLFFLFNFLQWKPNLLSERKYNSFLDRIKVVSLFSSLLIIPCLVTEKIEEIKRKYWIFHLGFYCSLQNSTARASSYFDQPGNSVDIDENRSSWYFQFASSPYIFLGGQKSEPTCKESSFLTLFQFQFCRALS